MLEAVAVKRRNQQTATGRGRWMCEKCPLTMRHADKSKDHGKDAAWDSCGSEWTH